MFIIDDKSILRQITINDHHVGRNVSEVFRLINAMQYEDKSHEAKPPTCASAGRCQLFSLICISIFDLLVTPDSVRRPRPLKCGERSSLREVIE